MEEPVRRGRGAGGRPEALVEALTLVEALKMSGGGGGPSTAGGATPGRSRTTRSRKVLWTADHATNAKALKNTAP